MTIAQYFGILRRQWLVVLLLAVLSTAGAAAYTWLAAPKYEATLQLFVSTSSGSEDIRDISQAGTFTQQRVKSYVSLVSSPKVLEPVASDVGLPAADADALAKQVTAASPLDTVLINVTVTDTSPDRAEAIAAAIGNRFPTLINALETPAGQAASPVRVSVTRPATALPTPVSPKKSLNLALGFLVGLGLGVGGAVLRDSLDRSLTHSSQLAELAGAPVLAAIVDDPDASKTPLITHDAFSARAEAFRQLRTNLRFLSVDHPVSSVVVTGSVQAEGKSTTAANLAIALAQGGQQVVLVDADLRRPTIADVFGMPGGVGLTNVLLGDVPLDGALLSWRPDLPLRVLTSGPVPPNPSELIGSERMAQLIRALTEAGTIVVVDSPPLLPVTDAAVLSRITDGAVLVARAASTHRDQVKAAVDALRTAGAPVLGAVLNRLPKSVWAGYGQGYRKSYGYASYAPTTGPGGPALTTLPAAQLTPPVPAPSTQPPVSPSPAPIDFRGGLPPATRPGGLPLNGYGRIQTSPDAEPTPDDVMRSRRSSRPPRG